MGDRIDLVSRQACLRNTVFAKTEWAIRVSTPTNSSGHGNEKEPSFQRRKEQCEGDN